MGAMKEYELNASLTTPDGGEYLEQLYVEAKSLAEAKKQARLWGLECMETIGNGARLRDYYAIDMESLEYSD